MVGDAPARAEEQAGLFFVVQHRELAREAELLADDQGLEGSPVAVGSPTAELAARRCVGVGFAVSSGAAQLWRPSIAVMHTANPIPRRRSSSWFTSLE